MKRKLTACLLIFAIWVLLPVAAYAQEKTLTTKIPSSHTLHIDIAGNGRVIVDGVPCKQTGDLQIPRGTTPQISVKPTNGGVIKTATLNEKDITDELRKGTYSIPEMCFDTKLTVVFETVPGTPQTGDPVPVTALCFVMVLSFIGLLYCLLLQRKRKY